MIYNDLSRPMEAQLGRNTFRVRKKWLNLKLNFKLNLQISMLKWS